MEEVEDQGKSCFHKRKVEADGASHKQGSVKGEIPKTNLKADVMRLHIFIRTRYFTLLSGIPAVNV